MPKPKILVLLPCFNSEEFIDVQIASIFSQKGVDICVFALDDHSTDSTLQRLLSFQAIYNIKVFSHYARLGRASLSFIHLLQEALASEYTFEYIALADHDDIWGHYKLCNACYELEEAGAECFSSDVVSTQYSYRGFSSFLPLRKARPQVRYDFLFQSPGPGCTFLLSSGFARSFNNYLRENPHLLDKIFWHDWLIYAYARAFGFKWHIGSATHMLYIQRGSNETGANIGLKAAIVRLKLLFDGSFFGQSAVLANSLMPGSLISQYLSSPAAIHRFWILGQLFRLRREKHVSVLVVILLLFHQTRIDDSRSVSGFR